MEVHEGPGVLPGRYAGPAIPIHQGPTPQQVHGAEDRAAADVLAGRICAAAAVAARSECQLLDLIGEFDATDALRWWTDLKSVAHWLSWTCSMSPGVAREHVRVAKALRQMPTVRAAFGQGRLSYSKVREVTRVAGLVDEAKLCELALTATASQLGRMISAYRGCTGRRLDQQQKRSVTWRTRDDGMVELRALLPADEGAVLMAAVGAAKDQFGRPPAPAAVQLLTEVGERQVDTTPVYTGADALLDVARGFLATAPEDRSGEDRTLVVVHVSADTLAGDVPAGTFQPAQTDVATVLPGGDGAVGDVPAGTFHPTHEAGATPLSGDDGAVGDVPAGTSYPIHNDIATVLHGSDGAIRDVPAGTLHPIHEAGATVLHGSDGAVGDVPAGTLDLAHQGVAKVLAGAGVFADVPAGTAHPTHDDVATVLPGGDGAVGDVPAGMLHPTHQSVAAVLTGGGKATGDVPAGTSADPTCHIQDVGPVETETARRFACDADLLGAVIDRHGNVLALGRTQRFVSRAQRRALMIRDQLCRFPGCAQTRHLKAHHIVAWSHGGPTDLDNLILLCGFHHTAVHEGGMQIERGTGPGNPWRFVMPDGTAHQPWYTAEALPRLLQAQLDRQTAADHTAIQQVTSFHDPAARTIRPRWAGERFDLHACVEALFQITLPDAQAADAQAEAA